MAIRGNTRTQQGKLAFGIMMGYLSFGAIYVFAIVPILTSNYTWFSSLPNPLPYILYFLGYIFILSGTLGGFISLSTGKYDAVSLFLSGIAPFVVFSWMLDMWAPPLYLSWSGDVVVATNPSNLEITAVDYAWANIFMSLGLHGPLLFIATYAIVPFLAFIAAFLFLAPKQFTSMVR